MSAVNATHIEPLEDRDGTAAELHTADALFARHPEQLSDRHLRLLACYSPQRAREGFARRERAKSAAATVMKQQTSSVPVEQAQAAHEAAWNNYVAKLDAFIGLGADLAADDRAVKAAQNELSDALADADKHLRPAEMVLVLATWLKAINHKNAKRNEQIATLKAQVSEVRAFEYRGVWSAHEIYQRNQFVSKDGGMWIARLDGCVNVEPGTDSTAWTLAVLRGKEGKQGRDLR